MGVSEVLESLAGGIFREPEWMEKETPYWGLRIWHFGFFGLSGFLSLVIMLCCCFRFRIPRTKQEIEADYQRRIIAKKFRERLAHIKNSEMDNMNLQTALERIREDFLEEAQKTVDTVDDQQSVQLRERV